MDILEAIKSRHSVRRYTNRPLNAETVEALRRKINEANAEGGLHAQLVTGEPRAFGSLASYGKFTGVENYIVMAGRKEPKLDERVGYYGERLVLAAQAIGLNTCWVGMTYRKVGAAFSIGKGEKVVCMIAVGYGATPGSAHKQKTVEQVSNASAATPEWFRRGVEAALLAPSALNQQKFRFEYVPQSAGKPHVIVRPGFSIFGYTKIDMGIARLHFEVGAGKENFVFEEE